MSSYSVLNCGGDFNFAKMRMLDEEWGVYDDMSCFVASFSSKKAAEAAVAYLKLNPKTANSPAKLRKLTGCVFA